MRAVKLKQNIEGAGQKTKKKNYLKARILEPTGAAMSIASYVITINDPYNNT